MTSTATRWDHHRTSRLVLDHTIEKDLEEWHRIHSDPRVWSHLPSGRHKVLEQTQQMLQSTIEGWRQTGLNYWSVREKFEGRIVGCGGVRAVADHYWWNLYYRLDPEVHGMGYASELAQASIEAANEVDADRPVVAIMLEANPASWRVAEKVGLERIWEGPDQGNPDSNAVRLVYADRSDVEI